VEGPRWSEVRGVDVEEAGSSPSRVSHPSLTRQLYRFSTAVPEVGMEWWYAENGQQIGPVGEDALQDLIRTGAVQPSTLVWHSGLRNWIPYSQAAPAEASV